MAREVIKGSSELAKIIREAREGMNLTVDAAAKQIGISPKTWERYEKGESIRRDICVLLCDLLGFVPYKKTDNDNILSYIEEFKQKCEWSQSIEDNYGELAALSFSLGSSILIDYIEADLAELAKLPAGSHLGEIIGESWILYLLPEQFLTRYDYEFVFHLKQELCMMRWIAFEGCEIQAHSVLQELLIYMCAEQAAPLLEIETEDYSPCWVFDMFDDMDIVTFLYSVHFYLSEDSPFHFDYWDDKVFWMAFPEDDLE